MGHPFGEFEKNYVEADPHRIGRIYKKAVYREYTDAKFNRLMTRSADEQLSRMRKSRLAAQSATIFSALPAKMNACSRQRAFVC